MAYLFLVALMHSSAQAVPVLHDAPENFTTSIPVGWTYDADQKLLCSPAKWTTIALFFLANYVAHAATVKSLPGESFMSLLVTMFWALTLPSSGVARESMQCVRVVGLRCIVFGLSGRVTWRLVKKIL